LGLGHFYIAATQKNRSNRTDAFEYDMIRAVMTLRFAALLSLGIPTLLSAAPTLTFFASASCATTYNGTTSTYSRPGLLPDDLETCQPFVFRQWFPDHRASVVLRGNSISAFASTATGFALEEQQMIPHDPHNHFEITERFEIAVTSKLVFRGGTGEVPLTAILVDSYFDSDGSHSVEWFTVESVLEAPTTITYGVPFFVTAKAIGEKHASGSLEGLAYGYAAVWREWSLMPGGEGVLEETPEPGTMLLCALALGITRWVRHRRPIGRRC
jgi:hypothetical protein